MIVKNLSKYLLCLVILTNFPFISCFGTNNKITSLLEGESEKPKYKRNCCSLIYSVFKSLYQNNQVEHRYTKNKRPLEVLPKYVTHEIITYLDPLSIIKLSHVSKNFRTFINNDFWVKYNYQHNYQTFNEESSYLLILSSKKEAPPVKVMLANYYYEVGIKLNKKQLVNKASLLGLPKAQQDLTKNEKEYSNRYDTHYNTHNGMTYHLLSDLRGGSGMLNINH